MRLVINIQKKCQDKAEAMAARAEILDLLKATKSITITSHMHPPAEREVHDALGQKINES